MEIEDRISPTTPLMTTRSQRNQETLAVPTRSLVISPDLDALLEHEDRSRAQPIVTSVTELKSREVPFPPEPKPPTPEPQVGLPPPPRHTTGRQNHRNQLGHRRSISLTSDRKVEDQRFLTKIPKSPVHSLSSSMSNPYINPAPNLEEIFRTAAGDAMVTNNEEFVSLSRTQTRDTIDTLVQPDELPRRVGEDDLTPRQNPRPRDEISNAGPSSLQDVKQQSVSRLGSVTVVPRVDKLKLLGRIKPPNMGRGAPSSVGGFNRKSAKERAVDPRTVVMQTGMKDQAGQVERHRPLLSHGQQSSISSIESFNSYGPPSTAEHEPRVSISSTIYPESTVSFTPSIYNNPSPAFDMNPYRDSFMEIASPANPESNFDDQQRQSRPSIDSTQENNLSPLEFTHTPLSERSTVTFDAPRTERTYGVKPPIPSAPKPLFSRTALRLSRHSSPQGSRTPPPERENASQLPVRPLTTNFLDINERADLVRKSRKLARVFGQTPDADVMAQQESGRGIHVQIFGKTGAGDPRLLSNVRRHSMPLSPDDISFLSIVSPTNETPPILPERIIEIQGVAEPVVSLTDDNVHQEDLAPIRSSPPTSFIDLSEDPSSRKPRHIRSISQSTFDTIATTVNDPDDDRKRKRERLAKLHRFLGSRVPVGLVLGIDDPNPDNSLPPPLTPPVSKNVLSEEDGSRKAWLSRRRSSSANGSLPKLDDLDRVRVELDDREKAINVRRAQKMEKVFGVAPPQTLYHTRHSASPSVSLTRPAADRVAGFLPPASEAELNTIQRNPNRTSYMKSKPKKNGRPGTSESNKQLLNKESAFSTFDDRFTENHTLIYSHYQHSLNSLNDIIDRDDKESLAELHQYLHGAEPSSPPVAYPGVRKLSNASMKPERRRSLPARTSMISLASEISVSPSKVDPSAFQMRRRRAAKLTQFFGVDYRELICDVLDSIENGVEQEQERGTLRAEEVEDLLDRLRNLKSKRQSFI